MRRKGTESYHSFFLWGWLFYYYYATKEHEEIQRQTKHNDGYIHQPNPKHIILSYKKSHHERVLHFLKSLHTHQSFS